MNVGMLQGNNTRAHGPAPTSTIHPTLPSRLVCSDNNNFQYDHRSKPIGLDLGVQDLTVFCGRVLGSSTQAAFTEGKTSHQYREARFRLSLEGHASTDN
jgi:hypothetical protein